jgi:hypothetical protein
MLQYSLHPVRDICDDRITVPDFQIEALRYALLNPIRPLCALGRNALCYTVWPCLEQTCFSANFNLLLNTKH